MMMSVKILLLKNLEGNFSLLLYVLYQNQNMIIMLAIRQKYALKPSFEHLLSKHWVQLYNQFLLKTFIE